MRTNTNEFTATSHRPARDAPLSAIDFQVAASGLTGCANYALGGFPLGEQYASQGSQVIQNAAAAGDVTLQLGKVIRYEQEALFAPVSALSLRESNFFFHVSTGFLDRFRQHVYILVGPFDAVKWSFRFVHGKTSSAYIITRM
jgi:hypothetical protein